MGQPVIFDFYAPIAPSIGLLSIPHSGMDVPPEFEEFLVPDARTRNQDVDFAVDQLVDIPKLQQAGVAVLVARVHRVCVDLNREASISVLNWKENTQGKQLVLKTPSPEQTQLLIAKYHLPYYQMLKSSIEQLHTQHSRPSVIDLHSMPSRPTDYHLKINPNQKLTRPDFCVSDISGKSCQKEFIDTTCEQLRVFANNVTQNDPYFGGNVTRWIDANFPFTNNIQIEINRAKYMDEEKIELIPAYIQLKEKLTLSLLEVFRRFA